MIFYGNSKLNLLIYLNFCMFDVLCTDEIRNLVGEIFFWTIDVYWEDGSHLLF